jgi:histone-lysine N-methyltransferase SETMAR
LLPNDVYQVIQKKRPGKLSKIVLLHDITHPQTANVMKVTLVAVGWEIMNHPSYSPDLSPSDFYLFGPMKMHLGVQKFRTDEQTGGPELAMQSG